MSIKKVGLLVLIAVVFGAGFLSIIVAKKNKLRPPAPAPVLQPFVGKFDIHAVDDLWAGGLRIVLCGAEFSKPQEMRAMMTAAARRDFQGLDVTCKPVGSGTPCDGNVAARFRGAFVVQCFTSDGADLAERLVSKGILCGLPAQAGPTYKPCSPSS
ncbi:hypothetical protein [Mesorhizobium sp.]|uniref:hypothetical protein n=1 Tax=Mesorhizobium sp. TaxID=1871066 RepID=UPI000FE2DA87|nr:hypothetical protein [Mesorhizobium sp.]RWO01700.1 MAG: hypothetical protein EOS06_05565 [Mesorhizobium sp.]